MTDILVDEPLDSLKENILYLYNAGFFNIDFAYIIYRPEEEKYRLVFYDSPSKRFVDKRVKTIQLAKVEFVKYLVTNVCFILYDPVWREFDAPRKPIWDRDFKFINIQQKKNPVIKATSEKKNNRKS